MKHLSLQPNRFMNFFCGSLTLLLLFGFVEYGISSETSKFRSQEEDSNLPTYQPRFGRKQPVIAVIGENRMTELTDFMIPYGVLTSAKIAKVISVFPKTGPVQMFPALKIEAEKSFDLFDSEYPEGADYVIVPAVHYADDSSLLSFIQKQSAKGSTIIGVCDGVWVLANAGVLKDHKATGHWFSFSNLEKKFPDTSWVKDRRYIADQKIITTTGITASIPVSLALIEAISGKEKVSEIAGLLGAKDWKPTHKSSDFYLSGKDIYTAAKNYLGFWNYENLGIQVSNGMDEVVLALQADSFSRTYRSEVFSVSDQKLIRTKSGLLLHVDKTQAEAADLDSILENLNGIAAVTAYDKNLAEIESKYGTNTAAFVALQMEYPWRK
ncbi:DJ-1/PfpI family protein [Leptospira andrefontaineae]|uniref:Transcriptional regulator n=1 Tax=Leptospira andrefontaineae TaxID=2484976 RepID=A0A4R9H567_9LEPT|nr:DJ-1/PfpI family protein [Leptospira andrefontaineae]TGK40237.1 transcriptional regulator [Leptospira andrefontaineae]